MLYSVLSLFTWLLVINNSSEKKASRNLYTKQLYRLFDGSTAMPKVEGMRHTLPKLLPW